MVIDTLASWRFYRGGTRHWREIRRHTRRYRRQPDKKAHVVAKPPKPSSSWLSSPLSSPLDAIVRAMPIKPPTFRIMPTKQPTFRILPIKSKFWWCLKW